LRKVKDLLISQLKVGYELLLYLQPVYKTLNNHYLMKILLSSLVLLFSLQAIAQSGTITGKVSDAETKEALIGVTILVEGTTLGAITDLDGKFNIKNVAPGNRTLRFKYVGYEDLTSEVTIVDGQTTTVADVQLQSTAIGLSEVEVFANIVEDRRTPVAASTIGALEITEQLGTMQLPELLNSAPGIYATQGDGSYGDAYINIRGFGQEEVLFMINGVPMNDMENGIMYWSNFAGLSEVTRNMQVQRGLGASKLAVNSVGGTVNIVTSPSERKKGGNVDVTMGANANHIYSTRYRLTLNSGALKGGWAVTFQGSRSKGEGIRPGTYFDAWSYFLTASKELSSNHTMLFTIFGAPATRGRAYNTNTETYNRLDNYLHNPAMGYYLGGTTGANPQILSVSENKAHKPQMTLMSLWNINDKMTLTTSAYASIARVYGTARAGAGEILTNEGYQDFEAYKAANIANVQTIQNPYGDPFALPVTGSQSTRIIEARYNNHNWYGVISNLSYQLDPTTTIVGGVDLRDYKASHFAEVHHLLGGDFWVDKFSSFDNNLLTPNRIAYKGDKVRYDYDGVVRWGSAFAQLEKTINQFDIFASANYSRIQMWREGNYWSADPVFTENSFGNSDKRVFQNYNIKAGVNYRITGRHNVFVNAGKFTRAPYLRNVFVDSRYGNKYLNGLKNESIQAAEAGYSYRTGKLRANFNMYYTQWEDRILANEAFVDPRTNERQALTGLAALHKGIELDFRYEVMPGIELTGSFSKGDWEWTSNSRVSYRDSTGVIDTDSVNTKGLKVGNSAQTTAFIGMHYKRIRDVYFGFRLNYFGDLYESFDPAQRTGEFQQVRKLPDYFILDIYGGYFFNIGDMRSRAGFNVHNLLNDRFIRRSDEGFGGQEAYGFPINFNVSMTVYFNN
jgi:iron complex outermembrane receptor protein